MEGGSARSGESPPAALDLLVLAGRRNTCRARFDGRPPLATDRGRAYNVTGRLARVSGARADDLSCETAQASGASWSAFARDVESTEV